MTGKRWYARVEDLFILAVLVIIGVVAAELLSFDVEFFSSPSEAPTPEIAALEAQLEQMRQFQDALLQTVYFGLGAAFLILTALVGFGWFQNRVLSERQMDEVNRAVARGEDEVRRIRDDFELQLDAALTEERREQRRLQEALDKKASEIAINQAEAIKLLAQSNVSGYMTLAFAAAMEYEFLPGMVQFCTLYLRAQLEVNPDGVTMNAKMLDAVLTRIRRPGAIETVPTTGLRDFLDALTQLHSSPTYPDLEHLRSTVREELGHRIEREHSAAQLSHLGGVPDAW